MRGCSWFLLLAIGLFARAQSLESRYLQGLAVARSVDEVAQLRSEYDKVKLARIACQIQTREHRVPSACYEEIALAKTNPADRQQRIARLDAQCLSASANLHVDADLGDHLSAFCAQKVREARAIEAYRGEESAP